MVHKLLTIFLKRRKRAKNGSVDLYICFAILFHENAVNIHVLYLLHFCFQLMPQIRLPNFSKTKKLDRLLNLNLLSYV